MSNVFSLASSPADRAICANEAAPKLILNGFTVQRIVYELIKKYMLNVTPAEANVFLAKSYSADPTQSGIVLDVAYNWKAQVADKVPAVYVQRGEVNIKQPTMGQEMSYDAKTSSSTRLVLCTMDVLVSCIAASPIAVVENLAEYVKQPLMYFKREVMADFRLRNFAVTKISSPALVKDSKNNFAVEILVSTAFDEGWVIQKDDLKLKSVGVELFDDLIQGQTLIH